MKKSKEVSAYIANASDDKIEALTKLRNIFNKNLDNGFEECINYRMIGFVVPHSVYPKGYHCDAKQPLPFVNIAAQKNFVAIYHMGMYGHKPTLDWFVAEYPKHAKTKLDMGKACIRFKKMDDIPYKLIEELSQKISSKAYIEFTEKALAKK